MVETPYHGNWWRRFQNRRFARQCLKDSLGRGEAPLASHLLYPQVLNDTDASERRLGIAAGLAWLAVAEASVVYVDRGVSPGMRQGIAAADRQGIAVEYRRLKPPEVRRAATDAGG